jgi:hypothetical protein
MPIAVIGNPFSGSDSKLEGMATAAFERHYRWLKAKFHVVPAKTAVDKILFVFDPIGVLHSREICADPAGVTFDRSGPKMRIGAIYCSGSLVSEVWANLVVSA